MARMVHPNIQKMDKPQTEEAFRVKEEVQKLTSRYNSSIPSTL